MSTIDDDGGPAFPRNYEPGWRVQHGMSLRDWFAGQALPQAVEDYDRKTRGAMDVKQHVHPWATEVIGEREQIIARQAYRYADAMLAARKSGA